SLPVGDGARGGRALAGRPLVAGTHCAGGGDAWAPAGRAPPVPSDERLRDIAVLWPETSSSTHMRTPCVKMSLANPRSSTLLFGSERSKRRGPCPGAGDFRAPGCNPPEVERGG